MLDAPVSFIEGHAALPHEDIVAKPTAKANAAKSPKKSAKSLVTNAIS
jgi:hypothetical protein